eukprot:434720-Amphidinium_carterae.1
MNEQGITMHRVISAEKCKLLRSLQDARSVALAHVLDSQKLWLWKVPSLNRRDRGGVGWGRRTRMLAQRSASI